MPGPALCRGDPGGIGKHTGQTHGSYRREPQNNASGPNRQIPHLGPLLTADPVTDPGSPSGHRRALSGPARSASGLSALFPRRERPHTDATRDKFSVLISVWGGVSRPGTGPGAGRCRVSAQSRSPHSRVRDGHGAYRLCCGLACGVDARAPAPPRSGPRSPAPYGPLDHWDLGPRARACPRIAALGRLVDVSRDPNAPPNAEKATGPNADAHGRPAQNPQNSRHRAENQHEAHERASRSRPRLPRSRPATE